MLAILKHTVKYHCLHAENYYYILEVTPYKDCIRIHSAKFNRNRLLFISVGSGIVAHFSKN